MKQVTQWSRLLVGTGIAVVVAAALAAPASAQIAAAGSLDPHAAAVTRSVGHTARAGEYWTEERMAQARPADAPQAGKDPARPVTEQSVRRLASAATGQGEVSAALTMSNAVGKVYFVDPADGQPYHCSASTVNNPAKNMVFTAGHCVHQGDGGTWMREWTFVPAKRNDREPFGKFTAYALGTLNGWSQDGSLGYDSGVALLNANDRGRVVDLVGGNGLVVGGAYEKFRTIIGYPRRVEDGTVQAFCQGDSHQAQPVIFPRQVEIGCVLGGGASGGPWHIDYQDRPDGSGLGDVNGVTSNEDFLGGLRSPYFTNDGEGNLYRQLANG